MTAAKPTIRRRPCAGAGLRMRRGAMALALGLPLAGCASGPSATFDLTASTPSRPARALRGQVAVTEPLATAPMDSDRIVVRPAPGAVATVKDAQWVERLPRLIQTRLIQSFENARLLGAVSRPDGHVVAQFSLNTEIRRFDMNPGGGEAVVEMSARLVEEGVGRIVAAKIFTARRAVADDDGPSAAAALDAALGEVMGQIVLWTAGRV